MIEGEPPFDYIDDYIGADNDEDQDDEDSGMFDPRYHQAGNRDQKEDDEDQDLDGFGLYESDSEQEGQEAVELDSEMLANS